MAYIGSLFEITNVSVSASPVVYGASVVVSYTLKNISGTKLVKLGASVNVNEESFDPARSGGNGIVIDGHEGLGNTISFLNGATKSFSYTFTFVNSSIAALFTQYPNVRSVPFQLDFIAEDANGWGVGGMIDVGTVLGMRYVPAIPTFTASRSPNADSTGAAVGLKCTLASGASPTYPGLSLTLKWKEDGAASFPAGNTLAVTVADALATNGTTVNPSYTFEVGKAYILRATFTDGIDSAFSEIKLSKAEKTLNVHPTSKNIGLGQFAVADLDADDVMRMDMAYRPYFHEGIGAMTKAHIIAMLGIQTGRSGATNGLAANATTDVTVTFPTAYKEVPLLFMYPDSAHTPASVGSLLFTLVENSLTATGFKVRWFNNTSSVRYINIDWTAIGELDT